MSVVAFTETTSRDGSQDVDSNKRYRRTFQVLTGTPQDGAAVVLAYAEIPNFNDAYAYTDDTVPEFPVLVIDGDAVVVQVEVSQDDDNLQNWTVIVHYAGVEDPEAQPAEVDYSPTRYQKALVEDLDDEPVRNSAGDPFADGITVDRTRFTLVVTKNLVSFDPVEMLEYQDTVNQAPFLVEVHPPGFDAETCKLTVGAKRVRKQGTSQFYWAVRYEIDIDREGWRVKPRDAGFNYYDAVANKKLPIISEATGLPYSTPQLLDGSGAVLPQDGDPVIAGPGGAGFKGYEVKDWAPLGITY